MKGRFLCLALALSLLSCQSDGFLLKERKESSYTLITKIFNGESRACAEVDVTIVGPLGKKRKGQSDITGKVLFPHVPVGEYRVLMVREGYESLDFPFSFERPDQALYGKLYSQEHLLRLCRDNMEQERWEDAKACLNRASAIKGEELFVGYHRAIFQWKTGDPEKASHTLETLENRYKIIPKEILLFHADIKEYDLEENEAALKILLILAEDYGMEDLAERIGELQNDSEENP